ncbi:hypothetical protein D3C75_200280 [compost metagenome]
MFSVIQHVANRGCSFFEGVYSALQILEFNDPVRSCSSCCYNIMVHIIQLELRSCQLLRHIILIDLRQLKRTQDFFVGDLLLRVWNGRCKGSTAFGAIEFIAVRSLGFLKGIRTKFQIFKFNDSVRIRSSRCNHSLTGIIQFEFCSCELFVQSILVNLRQFKRAQHSCVSNLLLRIWCGQSNCGTVFCIVQNITVRSFRFLEGISSKLQIFKLNDTIHISRSCCSHSLAGII